MLYCWVKSFGKAKDCISLRASKMQNLWDITIEAKTFEDFPTTLSEEGRQSDYNNYIANQSDIAVFHL